MKKYTLVLASFVLLGGMIMVTSCKTEDTTKPVITITSDDAAHNRVEQFSTTSYTDMGATATDDQDGTLSTTPSGSVDMSNAGDYVITYTATDAAGNSATADRAVTVDGGLYLAGSYTVEDFVGSTSTGTYAETITTSSVTYNKINFTKFGYYTNATVYATISGKTITIPTQTVHCGLTPNDKDHTFSGSGTYSSATGNFTITFHDSSSDGEFDCHDVYTLN